MSAMPVHSSLAKPSEPRASLQRSGARDNHFTCGFMYIASSLRTTGPISGAHTLLQEDVKQVVAGQESTVLILARDRYRNRRFTGGKVRSPKTHVRVILSN